VRYVLKFREKVASTIGVCEKHILRVSDNFAPGVRFKFQMRTNMFQTYPLEK